MGVDSRGEIDVLKIEKMPVYKLIRVLAHYERTYILPMVDFHQESPPDLEEYHGQLL